MHLGTFLGPFETPAGVIQDFSCRIGTSTMFAQLGVLPDFASAVAASALVAVASIFAGDAGPVLRRSLARITMIR